ncbi:MAG TPA: enoyl-CoA hydratase-related protein [Solirubrobacteraceae bacterium]|jgi:enoyl-CoA hydratase/carnithine racemase|nr:enoyl-CoA hydratase-related protein [Solirubrobacteraceae bacterium]
MQPGEASAYETIGLEIEDGIATITLARPQRLNAMTTAMAGELLDALDRIDGDDDARVTIVTGSGRAFCAGSDLHEAGEDLGGEPEPFDMARHADAGGTITRRLLDCAKPVIAAINGPAVGIGITMTLAMDIRLLAEGARVGFVFTKRGLVPEAASSFLLPRIVGIAQAAEWIYTARIFDSAEALRGGLVRGVYPAGCLLESAVALGREIADGTSAVSVAMSRRMLWQMLADGDPVTAHELDSEALHQLRGGGDLREGIDSFLAKREPRFPLRVSADMPDVYDRWRVERTGPAPPPLGAQP